MRINRVLIEIQQAMQVGLHNCVLWFCGSVYHLVAHTEWGGYLENMNSRNLHLRLDFLLFFACGFMDYVFPKMMEYMVRCHSVSLIPKLKTAVSDKRMLQLQYFSQIFDVKVLFKITCTQFH